MERRLSAILTADVVGYSRLMGADEAGTLRSLMRHRAELFEPKAGQYGGRIIKLMGDGILMEFGSVVDAVSFAVEVQSAMRLRNRHLADADQIQFRIGINIGDVIVEGQDIYGDGVNVAARLEGLADAGGICIAGNVREQIRDKIDLGLEDMGEVAVKNIARPIQVFRIAVDERAEALSTPVVRLPAARIAPRAILPIFVGLAALVVMGLTGAALWWQPWFAADSRPVAQQSMARLTDKPSIAVLPFFNMSNDPDQEYFVDGMTLDLITDLSKFSSLFVIASNSVFDYKGQDVPVDQIARELGVRFVLEGSVRAAGGKVRINSQLTDTNTGTHIWADRFDRELSDVFTLQDDVTREIVSALALELTAGDRARLESTEKDTTPEVYDLYLRGIEGLRQYSPESISRARAYLLKALSIDPEYARAHAAMAFTYTSGGIFFRGEATEQAIAQGLRYSQRAVELDETLPQGHFALAIAYLRQGLHDKAQDAARKAVAYDPNYADGYAGLANVLNFSGQASEAVAMMQRAMELNPRFSAAYIDILGRTYFFLGEYDKAIGQLNKCVTRDPELVSCQIFLAAAYGLNGQIDDAQWHGEEILSLMPEFVLKSDAVAPQIMKAVDLERYQSGLKIAGIPEN